MPKVSIVVPVCNTAKWLDRCMESILCQSFTDIEILLVDDGSSDESPKMCDAYAAKDSRVKVIHQQNAGLSAARNAGTEISRGELITYIDSDDYVEPYYVEFLLRSLEMSGAECALARSDRVPEDTIKTIPRPELRYESWSTKDALSGILTSQKTTVSSWNKLAPREWYIKERYPQGKLYEDLFHTHRVLMQAKSVVFADAVLYHYAMNAGSITGRKTTTKKQCIDYYEAARTCADETCAAFPELIADSYVLLARDFMSLYLNICRCETLDGDIADIREKVLLWFKMYGFKAARNKKAPTEVRLRIFLMSISPKLYKWAFYKGIKYKGKTLG